MRRVVVVVCALLVCVPLYMKSRSSQGVPARAAFPVVSPDMVTVKVCGDVRHAGIYYVSANKMAIDAIIMADPLRPLYQYKIDPSASRPLYDGAVVSLSMQSDESALVSINSMAVEERLVMALPLDIDLMSEADFDRLPGIGPSLARRIGEYRQQNGGMLRVIDLINVEGIGEKKYATLREYFQHAKNIK